LNTKHSFSIVVTLAFLGTGIQYENYAYGASNDKLDVNLNVIYIGTKSQKDSNSLSEVIAQFPFPLTQHSRDTGQGLFGGVTYFDFKTLVNSTRVSSIPLSPTIAIQNTQLVTEMGLGRIYYSYSVPGQTPYTFVPFVTFYREFSYSYIDSGHSTSRIHGKSFLLPGVMYAYRFNERVALHFDVELYSYSERTNNRSRLGFTYSPSWPWIISASHERLSWDIDSNNVFVDGKSRENNLKIIYRDPPMGNFALTLGYGNQYRNANGPGLWESTITNSKGTYFGVEASAGVLAW
jgi:hypothetical protein